MADDAHAEASERAIDAGMELEGRGDTAPKRIFKSGFHMYLFLLVWASFRIF